MSIIQTAIKRPVTVAMFTLALVVFGLVLASRLGLNLLPNLAYPTMTVRANFPGAGPQEIETLISRPLEESLGTLKGLRQMRSVSKAGRADIYLEFAWGSDMDMVSLDIREKLEQVQLPLDVKRPTLLRFDPNNEPIMRLVLATRATTKPAAAGPTSAAALKPNSSAAIPPKTSSVHQYQLTRLRRWADIQISRRLESVDGVAAAKASGGLEDEIQIELDQEKLARYKLNSSDIAARLKAQNINLSGGEIRSGQQKLLVRTYNEFKNIKDFENTVLRSTANSIIRLKDVATVRMSFKDPTAIIRLNGHQAVEIAIYKEGDANTVNVARAVRERIEKIRKNLPATMALSVLTDASKFIRQSITDLRSAAIIGGLLAMLVIYLFLGDSRSTFFISLIIPLSVIVTFNLMYAADVTLNIMSLGGLALAVGMLVDNAIVVLENIKRRQEAGDDLRTAAEVGTQEVAAAITASTLTTIAVFLPLIFVQGIAGQLFRDQALTITFSLLVSLLFALTVLPTLSARGKRVIAQHFTRKQRSTTVRSALLIFEIPFVWLVSLLMMLVRMVLIASRALGSITLLPAARGFARLYAATERIYGRMLASALKHPLLILGLAIVLLLVSLELGSRLPQVVLPEMAQGRLVVRIEFSAGLPITVTDQKLVQISNSLLKLQGVRKVFATAGVGNRLTANPEEEGENVAQLSLLLNSGLSRADEDALLVRVRSVLSKHTDITKSESTRPQLFSFEAPVSIELFGYDLHSLDVAAGQVQAAIRGAPHLSGVHSSLVTGQPELQVSFDLQKLSHLGISTQAATDTVVNAIRGSKATRYRLREQQIDVLVRVRKADRDQARDLARLLINPDSVHPIPLGSVATIRSTLAPSEIRRIDQQRVVVIQGQVSGASLSTVLAEIKTRLRPVQLPVGVEMIQGGQSAALQKSFDSLLMALALAIFLVYLVMASQFESLLHPFIILLSIPLALVGAIFALAITQTQWSVVVFLGMIMLAGIVVNNAIVLVDRINQLRQQGIARIDAIMQAAATRLRPILMTTLTTVLGMLPLALGSSEGSEIRAPMAITVIGGLLGATLLTLVVIPVLYELLDRKSFSSETLETPEVF